MKKVKFDGFKWILFTEDGGFFNPNKYVYFSTLMDSQSKMAKLAKTLRIDVEIDKVYEIPDSGIYTSVCGPKCGPFWPDSRCGYCGGKGVAAMFSDSGFQMGGTDEGNKEVELIKQGKSNIHPELKP